MKNKKRFQILFLVWVMLIVFPSVYAQTVRKKSDNSKPNILMITTHDIGRHLNCYGVKTVHSPNIDKLAHKGVMFTNFYSTSSVCTPGRGSLHTGRYPQSNGLLGLNHAPWWWRLNDDEKHTAEILRSNGYETD